MPPNWKTPNIPVGWQEFIKYLFIISLVIILFQTFLVIRGSLEENASLEKSRTFHIAFDHYFYKNNTTHLTNSYPDIQIDLSVNYPRGILVVDDVVTISGIAIAYTPITRNITDIAVNFLNSQANPKTQDKYGITQGISINLLRIPNSNKFVGNASMVWRLEGTYYPQLFITGYPNNESPIRYYKTDDVAITVYPKSELAQIVTNKAVLWLTIIADILAILGTINIVNTKNPTTQTENQNNASTNTNDIADHKNESSKERRSIKEPKKRTRSNKPKRK